AARVKGYRTGENPARWKGHLKHLLPPRRKLTKGHFAAVPYTDMPDLMKALREAEGIGARALEFATLCGVRTGDIIGMRWSEVDLEQALWTIPKERVKGHRSNHSVPLSSRAVEVLQIIRDMRLSDRPAAHVFPGTKEDGGLSDAAMRAALRRLGRTETVHGMRSALRDWAGNETTFPRELAEEVLAHVVGNEVEQAYRRSEAINKRRSLLGSWASYLGGENNVVALAASAS
ncbi:MAG: integrase, partial [Verrucomicrobiaceae bacterium]